jgi:hypothetical protein
MKITTNPAPVAFNPVTIEITCHTLDEMRVLWAMANAPTGILNAQAGNHANIKAAVAMHTNSVNGANTVIFTAIDAALTQAGGKN